ncbi:hypothetical protein FACS1894174_02130 [Bacteroidia bacterium]|nr:hypothetical protein FACS1894174_02130 [Bacteroidia bacterium]
MNIFACKLELKLMEIVINPRYEYLKDFVKNLPGYFESEGKTIYQGRNEIKVLSINDNELVIKSFRIPNIINKIVYAYFRPSKAKRSYENGMKLMENGIGTPEPVAYIESFRYGNFYRSYYISRKSLLNRNFRELSDLPQTSETHAILDKFAQFTANLHEKHIFHKDYTPGNILFDQVGQEYRFDIIDINRMKFCEVDMKTGCKNFESLYIEDDMFRFLSGRYAFYRKFDPDTCEKLVMKYRRLRD